VAAQVFYGWRLLGAFWLIAVINLAFPAYGSAVLNAAMAAELGFDRQALGTLVAVYLAMSGLPGPLVAASVNRIGVRWTLVIGSVFLIAGSVMLATIVDTVMLAILAFGLLVGIGVATGAIIAAQAGVARWFVRRRALAFSLLYSAGAIGGFVAPPVLSAIATGGPGQWRLGWWLIAALSVVAALIAIATVREHPADLGQAPDGAAGSEAPRAAGVPAAATRIPAFVTRTDWTYREALHGPYFWTMITPFVGVSAGFALFLGHGIVHLQDLGHSMQVGAWAVGTMTISGLIAKAVLAVLGDRLDPRFLWATFCASFGVGMLILVGARAPAAVTVAAVCLGIGFGGGIVAMMATLSNYYGTRAFASLSGLAIAINTGISSLAPIIAGRMYDLGLGYSNAFYVIAAWCIAGGALLALMKRPRYRASVSTVTMPGSGV
jgi:MFS family permease